MIKGFITAHYNKGLIVLDRKDIAVKYSKSGLKFDCLSLLGLISMALLDYGLIFYIL